MKNLSVPLILAGLSYVSVVTANEYGYNNGGYNNDYYNNGGYNNGGYNNGGYNNGGYNNGYNGGYSNGGYSGGYNNYNNGGYNGYNTNDRILLQDLKTFTVYKDRKTNGRRSVVDQVSNPKLFYLFKCS